MLRKCLDYILTTDPMLYGYLCMVGTQLILHPYLLIMEKYGIHNKVPLPPVLTISINRVDKCGWIVAGVNGQPSRRIHLTEEGKLFVRNGIDRYDEIISLARRCLMQRVNVTSLLIDIWLTPEELAEQAAIGCVLLRTDSINSSPRKAAINAYHTYYEQIQATGIKRGWAAVELAIGRRPRTIDVIIELWNTVGYRAVFQMEDSINFILNGSSTCPNYIRELLCTSLTLEDVVFVQDMLLRFHIETAKAIAQQQIDITFKPGKYV